MLCDVSSPPHLVCFLDFFMCKEISKFDPVSLLAVVNYWTNIKPNVLVFSQLISYVIKRQ